MLVTDSPIRTEDFESATGWVIKPEGACKGGMCVPLPDGVAADGMLDVTMVAGRLGMPVVLDGETGMRSIGPASIGGRALSTAEAPDLTLPDLDGRAFRLSSLRGRKVLLVSWAPY